jgi:hypothetical protein
VLESVVEFCSEPELMVDLYCNYDVDIESSELFEHLCTFLANGCVAQATTPTNRDSSGGGVVAVGADPALLQRLSLDGGVALVESIWQIFVNPASSYRQRCYLQAGGKGAKGGAKQQKQRMAMAAKAFNENPRKSLEHLVGLGVLVDATDAAEVARFCRTCPGLDKEVLGQYLGKVSGEFNKKVLAAFAQTFDWTDTPLDLAVRNFLEAFRLPGEAQQIDLIMETFAARWFEGNTDKIKTQDTAFILAFSIIMLNTDLHNPNIRADRKMTVEQYIKMNRGIDAGGADVPPEILTNIYHSIKNNEIVMKPEAGAGLMDKEIGVMDDKTWSTLMRSSSSGGRITSAMGTIELSTGGDMFELVWEKLTQSMCAALESALGGATGGASASSSEAAGGGAGEGAESGSSLDGGGASAVSAAVAGTQMDGGNAGRVVFKVMQGFRRICDVADAYDKPAVVNSCLSRICTALQGRITAVSELVGRSGAALAFRGSGKLVLQLIDAVFALALAHVHVLESAWPALLSCVLRLNCGKLKLLPSGLVELDDFVDSQGRPLPSTVALLQRDMDAQADGAAGGEAELQQSFFSMIWGATPDLEQDEKRREGDAEALAHAKMLVANCHIEDLLAKSRELPLGTVAHLVDALLRASGGVGCLAAEAGGPAPSPRASPAPPAAEALNDELLGRVYCLEWLTNVCVSNQSRFEQVWPLMAAHFERGIAAASRMSGSGAVDGEEAQPEQEEPDSSTPSLLVERHVVSVLRICTALDLVPGLTIAADSVAVDTVLATLRPLVELELGAQQVDILGERVMSGAPGVSILESVHID